VLTPSPRLAQPRRRGRGGRRREGANWRAAAAAERSAAALMGRPFSEAGAFCAVIGPPCFAGQLRGRGRRRRQRRRRSAMHQRLGAGGKGFQARLCGDGCAAARTSRRD
jgi:hypothetical protein